MKRLHLILTREIIQKFASNVILMSIFKLISFSSRAYKNDHLDVIGGIPFAFKSQYRECSKTLWFPVLRRRQWSKISSSFLFVLRTSFSQNFITNSIFHVSYTCVLYCYQLGNLKKKQKGYSHVRQLKQLKNQILPEVTQNVTSDKKNSQTKFQTHSTACWGHRDLFSWEQENTIQRSQIIQEYCVPQ